MTKKAPNRIGRRAPLSLRTSEETRAKLEAAASAAGRSLTAELERRLDLSFEWERAYRDVDVMLQCKREDAIQQLHTQLDYRYATLPSGMKILLEPGQVAQLGADISVPEKVLAYLCGSSTPAAMPMLGGGLTVQIPYDQPTARISMTELEMMMERAAARGLRSALLNGPNAENAGTKPTS